MIVMTLNYAKTNGRREPRSDYNTFTSSTTSTVTTTSTATTVAITITSISTTTATYCYYYSMVPNTHLLSFVKLSLSKMSTTNSWVFLVV